MYRFFSLAKKLLQKLVRSIFNRNHKPKILKEAGFDFYWNDAMFRSLDMPVSEMPIKELEWNLDLPFWEEDLIDDWNLTPREVVEHPEWHKTHARRMKESDLDFPICIAKNKNGKWFVVDGTHRLAKAFLEERVSILVKEVPGEEVLKAKIER